jgi:hypothetical protein
MDSLPAELSLSWSIVAAIAFGRGGRLNWAQFAADSPLEESGFEPSVPL